MKLLALFWLAYFVIHSVLASLRVKRWFARRHPASVRLYRLGFNLVSLILLLPILWQMNRAPGPILWTWSGWAAWLGNALALAALAGFAASLRDYDGQAFLGLRQMRAERSPRSPVDATENTEEFRLSPFHRFVRHPWYFFSLVLIWTRDMNGAMLVSAILLTLYFWIGSRLEEQKLMACHGDVYRRYTQLVPGLIPRPGKSLSADQAAGLIASAKERKNNVDRFVAGNTRSGV